MARHLFIVSKDHQNLYDYLLGRFATDGNVTVILDRRNGERRQAAAATADERRREDRRGKVLPENELWPRSHQIITFDDSGVPATTPPSP